ncbi:MAG: FkbM family methyltransferase [Betaproteobacteria bacterium]|nr:FkbM family methyltransferase [Betaproteobacteria bacterium]MBI2961285.1 FkbM family methyltransferase [Betaproteobacteria bacterium]
MKTLAALADARSADELRAALIERHPAFAAERLGRLAIFGAAGEGERLAKACRERGIAIAAISDENPARQGQVLAGVKVGGIEALAALERDTPVVVASHRTLAALRRLRALGFRNCAPFALLQLLAPEKFRPHMFHEGLLEDLCENRSRYEALAAQLADEFSRRVLDAVIAYRMTLDPEVLDPIVEWDLYNPAGLLNLGSDEVYVDGGAFDGDSIALFVKRVNNRFSGVIGFEPDRKTFARLQARFAGDARVRLVNGGLHARAGELRFAGDASRGSIFEDSGGEVIPVVSLDSVLAGDRVSFIKMNIEGSEIEALAGAAESIRRHSPRLAISAYHRPSDLWAVPEAIRALVPRYALYLRQHDGGIIETVCYAQQSA